MDDGTVSHSDSSTDLKAFADELIALGENHRAHRLRMSENNEEFYLGKQGQIVTPTGSDTVDLWRDSRVAPVTHNHIRNALETIIARLAKGRPNVSAYPTTAEAQDIIASGIADKIIETKTRTLSLDDKIHKMLRLAYLHGTGGFKIFFDPTTQDIPWDPISIFDFLLDPSSDDLQAGKWVIFTRFISSHAAKAAVSGIEGADEPSVTSYRAGVLEEEQAGVAVYELWHLPDERVPEGLFMQVVGGVVAAVQPYPPGYTRPHPDLPDRIIPYLPIVVFKPLERRGSPYGDTPTDSALEPQARLNHLESVLAHMERLAGSIRWIGPASVNRQMRTGVSHYIDITTPAEMSMSGFTQTPVIPGILMENREFYLDRIFKLFGVSAVSVGAQETKSNVAARSLAYISELDSDKMAGAAKDLNAALLDAWKITLSLMQNYFITDRIVRMTGASGLEVHTWKGAMLSGVDIELVESSSLDAHPKAKGDDYAEKAKAGMVDPKSVNETMATGHVDSNYATAQQNLADFEVEQLLSGQPILDLQADAAQAIPHLATVWQLLQAQGQENESQQVKNLMKLYQEKAQRAASKMQENG